MRIKEILIKNLFNLFDYKITLNKTDRITIIHGPNGTGKTTILKLINGLFKARYWVLGTVPFKKFEIIFDDNSYLRITKKIEKKKNDFLLENLIFEKPGAKVVFLSNDPTIEETINRYFFSFFPSENKYFSFIKPNFWHDIIIGDNINTCTLIERYINKFPEFILEKIFKNRKYLENWLKPIIDIYFIESQRLFTKKIYELPYSLESYLREGPMLSVSNYSVELASIIKSYLTEYGSKSQSLDHSFPTRLLNKSDEKAKKNMLTDMQIKQELKDLEVKRQKLISVGLLSKEEEITVPQKEIDEHDRNVLSLYIQDVKEKLQIFDDIAEKLELLVKIINNRFRLKKITIDKDKGFKFIVFQPKNDYREYIEPSVLSSGEQHQLVLFYELLFRIKEKSLILIDEPEISLHLGWQKKFLMDLLKIAKTMQFDIIIATHSPLIINDRWDLTVELEVP